MAAVLRTSVDDLLDDLQAQGKNLKEFSADVTLTETDTVMDNSTKRSGKVWFQMKENGDARMHLIFSTKQVGEKPAHPESVE